MSVVTEKGTHEASAMKFVTSEIISLEKTAVTWIVESVLVFLQRCSPLENEPAQRFGVLLKYQGAGCHWKKGH